MALAFPLYYAPRIRLTASCLQSQREMFLPTECTVIWRASPACSALGSFQEAREIKGKRKREQRERGGALVASFLYRGTLRRCSQLSHLVCTIPNEISRKNWSSKEGWAKEENIKFQGTNHSLESRGHVSSPVKSLLTLPQNLSRWFSAPWNDESSHEWEGTPGLQPFRVQDLKIRSRNYSAQFLPFMLLVLNSMGLSGVGTNVISPIIRMSRVFTTIALSGNTLTRNARNSCLTVWLFLVAVLQFGLQFHA